MIRPSRPEAVGEPYVIRDNELQVNFSIGISVCPDDAGDVETLIKFADMAMYEAKEGGGCFHFFTRDLNQKAQERVRRFISRGKPPAS